MGTEGLLKIEDISPKLIKAKISPDISCTIKPSKRQEFEEDGWEFVPSKLKNSIRMKKAENSF